MAKITGEDGNVIFGDAATITAATHVTGTVTITTSGEHGFEEGDGIFIDSVLGMTDLNGYHIITGLGNETGNQLEVSLTTAQEWVSGGAIMECIPVTNWSIEESRELIDVTDSSSASGTKTFIDSDWDVWSGSFEGFFQTGANPLIEGNSIEIVLKKADDNYYTGSAIITRTGVTVDVVGAEAVKKSYDFQGDGNLTHAAS